MKVIGTPELPRQRCPVLGAKALQYITADNEVILARKLFFSGFGSFMPESEVLKSLHPNPKHVIEASRLVDSVGLSPVLEAGWFAVTNKAETDRLILGRVPMNSVEHRLGWAELPHGTQISQLCLKPGEALRGGQRTCVCGSFASFRTRRTRTR